MKKIGLLLFLSLNVFLEALGCDCKYISKQEEYNLADLIFVGEISTVERDKFYVSMVESLKGDKTDSLRVVSIENCSIFPEQGETWLLYSTINEVGVMSVSKCGWSRSFQHPFQVGSRKIPPPPSPETATSLLLMVDKISKNLALSELYYDISTMRNFRLESSINEIKTKVESQGDFSFVSLLVTLRWILIIVSLTVLLSIVALIRKR